MSERKRKSAVSERRSAVGAPPSLSGRKYPRKGKVVEEAEDSENESLEEVEAQEENPSEDDGSKTPSKKRRKKRRIRLTEYSQRAAKKRREKERVKREAEEDEEDEEPEENEEGSEDSEHGEQEDLHKLPVNLREYSTFQLLCDNLLRKFLEKDPDEYFAYPVTQSMAPDYADVIKNPMDFWTIRQKIDKNEYKNIREMEADVVLIYQNAMTYNGPNTIYHLAAQKLATLCKYYFSENYMRYLRYSMVFFTELTLEQMGITVKKVVEPVKRKAHNALIDDRSASAILKDVDAKVAERLATRKPKSQLAFIDARDDGTHCLNLVTEEGRASVTLGDIIPKLEKGTPGMLPQYEQRLHIQNAMSYLNYGPYSSFAPQFDSTWATLNQRDSELLISTYGSRENASDAIVLKQVVKGTNEEYERAVDNMLDLLTDGEHNRTIAELEKEPEDAKKKKEWEEKAPEDGSSEKKESDLSLNEVAGILRDIESLENLGVDVGFIADIREGLGIDKQGHQLNPDEALAKVSVMLADLQYLQRQRLSQVPPQVLTEVPPPTALEVNLANRTNELLAQQIAVNTTPEDMASALSLEQSMGVGNEADDMDFLSEFLTFD
ncbi:hypothetical protein QR680_009027 [Steinernema hermaphroditum]|uniref:Bromo domain-containing protein n=1 Tax=Steinernema hermaphroditum TaxID=289476 RepID=A0AA39IK84_9BILA|nr:hypothetical protein QR680_009027 [Steinernema hermaphroditum]